jgi:hypothetical protein
MLVRTPSRPQTPAQTEFIPSTEHSPSGFAVRGIIAITKEEIDALERRNDEQPPPRASDRSENERNHGKAESR